METKKILKKHKKAEQKAKDRLLKLEKHVEEEEAPVTATPALPEKRERVQSNVSETGVTTRRMSMEESKRTEEPEGGEAIDNEKYFSQLEFKDLPLSEQTKKAIEGLGFKKCTEIQARSIPHILNGRDVLGAAKTGSGKTMAFMLPAVELLYKAQFTPKQGTGVLIIAPTRELAMQNYKWARDCLQFHSKTHGVVIGGAKRSSEAHMLKKGVNLLVATPGRLLDHL